MRNRGLLLPSFCTFLFKGRPQPIVQWCNTLLNSYVYVISKIRTVVVIKKTRSIKIMLLRQLTQQTSSRTFVWDTLFKFLLSSVGPVFKARFATPFAKQTGLQKPLNVSDILAKIIGTKKGESRGCPGHRWL